MIDFCKEIIDICYKQKVEPIVYGSLAVFVYTKNSKVNVNDIDLLIKEKDFQKLNFYGKTLKNVYKKAYKVSQDNPIGNKEKFETLNKLSNDPIKT